MTSLINIIKQGANRRFRRLALATVIIVYLLIIVGGVVRSTGAGMGCPDWPTCFGSWIPPTDISQLPADYQQIYGAKLKGEVVFNPVKTWTEYVNRLFGVFTGLMIIFTVVAAFRFYKTSERPIFNWSFIALLLVIFQGWLGAKVVSTELHPGMVTLHMLLAIVIVFILLYVYARSYAIEKHLNISADAMFLNPVLIGALLLSLFQILLGTQVREDMDLVIAQLGYDMRTEWISSLGVDFYIHRSFSFLVAAVNIWLFIKIRRIEGNFRVHIQLMSYVLLVIGLTVLTGVVMAYMGVPPYAQPLHLTLAIAMIGIQFVLLMFINSERFFGNRNYLAVMRGN